jgi:hypothetical protein
MNQAIEIVDRGRGPQLSTSRITVQDLVPYLLRHCTYEQVREIMPVLTVEEFRAIERYVREHHQEVMEQDRRIRQRAETRRKPPEVEQSEQNERHERLENARQMIRHNKQGRNGDLPAL